MVLNHFGPIEKDKAFILSFCIEQINFAMPANFVCNILVEMEFLKNLAAACSKSQKDKIT